MIKLAHPLHPNTQYVSTLTGEQYKMENCNVCKLGRDRWRLHKGVDLASGRFIPVEEYISNREAIAQNLLESMKERSTQIPAQAQTASEQVRRKMELYDIGDFMATSHLRPQPYIMGAGDMIQHSADEINIRGTATGRFTTQAHKPLFKEDTMSTFTAASLEARINPVPKADSTYQSVKELEKANEAAANEVIILASMIKTSATITVSRGGNGAQIPDKYLNRMNNILRDMRKDQELILDTTAATLVKVQKVVS
jgi:hypothetical protein